VTATPLNPQVLGQAESAHRALLDRILASSGHSYQHWVALSLTAGHGATIDRDELTAMMTSALKLDAGAARQSISELAADQLLEPTPGNEPRLQLTNTGRELHRQIRSAVKQTINQLYLDIPADDLAIAGRVLVFLTARANAELTRI